jgi:ATP-dependent DNA helicase RecG
MALRTLTTEDTKHVIAAGESLTVEFKGEERNGLPDREIYETVVCLANSAGGILLIGVENDGRVTGARPRHDGSTDPRKVQAAIFNNTMPQINTRIQLHEIDSQPVLAIEVDPYPEICMTQDGKCIRRVEGVHGPECRPFYAHEHISRRSDLRLVDYSAEIVDWATWSDLDPLEIERVRRAIRRVPGEQALLSLDDQQLVQALKLVESRDGELVPNIAGLLLVGQEESLRRAVPTAQTAFQVLDRAGNVLVNEWLSSPLVSALETIEERFDARNEEAEITVGVYRVPIPHYDPKAFREAINNAVLHRDYSRLGAVHIQLYPDYLFITNPGGFLEGITLENFLVHEPKPRNPLLAEASRRIGLVETTARGIDWIFLGQLRYGRPLPDYSRSDQTGVRLELRSGDASAEFTAFVFDEFDTSGPPPLGELIALNRLLDVRRTSAEDIGRVTQRGETFARSLMERLVERGWVEPRGRGKNRAYQLSAPLYHRFGSRAGYVRMHGFDTIRQESMVIEYVAAHGKITRGEVVELCGLESQQAKYLLRKLVDRGQLQMKDKRRNAYYVRSGSKA